MILPFIGSCFIIQLTDEKNIKQKNNLVLKPLKKRFKNKCIFPPNFICRIQLLDYQTPTVFF